MIVLIFAMQYGRIKIVFMIQNIKIFILIIYYETILNMIQTFYNIKN
jgi:hypothetical protein